MQSELIHFDDTKTSFLYKSTKGLRNAHFIFLIMNWTWIVKCCIELMTFAIAVKLPVKGLIKCTLFKQFCGGESINDCQKTIQTIGQYGVRTLLDYSVEGLSNEKGYEAVKDEALRVVEYASENPNIPFVVIKMSGLGSANLMTKVQEGKKLSHGETAKLHLIVQRVETIANKVAKSGLKLMIDAEESWFQDFVDEIAYHLMEKYNRQEVIVYNTYQMYRYDMLDRLRKGIINAREQYFFVGVKLVRGAYMEKERIRAQEKGYPSPIHATKPDVDMAYNNALHLCIDNIDQMGICIGTHNEDSCKILVQLMSEAFLRPEDQRIYFAQLLGMSDNISFQLAGKGYNVAKYVPYGPVEKVLPYLFRRAKENTSMVRQSNREYLLIKKELKRRRSQYEY